jgi:hypothetical protein
MPRARSRRKPSTDKEGVMALLEKEATRFAEALDDYEHVSVTDIGGWGQNSFWLVVRDHRFDLNYEIASHCDYWDFISALVDHKQYIAPAMEKEMA